MDKIFEALKNINIRCHSKVVWNDSIDSDLDIVKQAVTELKRFREAKPSVAIECLDELFDSIMGERLKQESKKYKTIKPALLKAQALEAELEEFLGFKDGRTISSVTYEGKQIIAMPLEEYDKLMGRDKVLEIIKEKPQAELSLIQLGEIKTYEEYLDYTDKWELDLYGDMVYTKEEFDLLRRWREK